MVREARSPTDLFHSIFRHAPPARPANLQQKPTCISTTSEDTLMLKWALVFAIIAIIAGALGFTGIAGASAAIAKILFFIFLAIFLILLVAGIMVGKKISGD